MLINILMTVIIEKLKNVTETIKTFVIKIIHTLLRRKDRGLFNQWQAHDDLPPREARISLPKKKGDLYQQWIEEGSLAAEDIETPVVKPAEQQASTRAASFFSGRLMLFLIISGALNVILLITVAVLATILAVR